MVRPLSFAALAFIALVFASPTRAQTAELVLPELGSDDDVRLRVTVEINPQDCDSAGFQLRDPGCSASDAEADRLRDRIRSIRLGNSVAMMSIALGVHLFTGVLAAVGAGFCEGNCVEAVTMLTTLSGLALATGIAATTWMVTKKRRRDRLIVQLHATGAAAYW